MANNNSITAFKGLVCQPNSFNAVPGSMETASNVIVKYNNIIDKRRGYNDYHKFDPSNAINNIFAFDANNFAVGSSLLFKFQDTPITAISHCFITSSTIIVNKRNHGLLNATYISEFNLPDSDNITPLFASRQAAFYGSHQISTLFTVLGTRLTGVVTVASPKHGLNNGDVITITNTGTLSVAVGSKTVTVSSADIYTFADAGLDASGNFIYNNIHSFFITVAQVATASASSGATSTTYRQYVVQPGISFTTTTVGKTRFVGTDYAGYFTTDKGLLKIESAANAFYRAGIPEALDIDSQVTKNSLGQAIGPVQGSKQISYRSCFGRISTNNILALGAPSAQNLMYSTLVYTASLSVNAGTHVVTVTSVAHGLGTGDKIYLSTASCTGGTIIDLTEFFITYLGPDTYSFDLDDQGLAAITAIASLYFSYDMSATLRIAIPSELTVDHIIQIFRTNVSVDLDTLPDPRYFKIFEAQLTATDITRGFVYFLDEQPSLLQLGAEELYTNYTREGEVQAAARPPRAKDITLYKGYLFYLNFETLQVLNLSLVNSDTLLNNSTIAVAGRSYKFVNNTFNEFLGNETKTKVVVTSGTNATVTAPNAYTAGDIIYVLACTTVNIPEGLYTIATAGATNFTFATTAPALTGTLTFEGRTDSTGKALVRLVKAGTVYTQAEAIESNSRALVKAINRDTASTVYAVYASLLDDRPGIIRLNNKYIETAAFAITATTGGAAFVPIIPTTGTSISSTNVVAEGEIMFSKYGEPEAVPYLNRLPVGSKNFEGLRLAALRDSIIFMKTDGVFRLNGDAPSNFSVTILDNTTLCKSKESVSILNNSVFCFCNKGIVSITDNAVQILSREIEPLLSSITGYTYIENVTSGVSYESERLYLLSTVLPTTALSASLETSDVVYAYNYLTDAWSTWSTPFSKGFNNLAEDRLYLINNSGQQISQERKSQSRLDYGDVQYAAPIRRSVIGEAISKASSPQLEVTTLVKHNLEAGNLITVSYTDPALGLIYTSATNVNGLRIVTGILSEYTFTFDAAINASGLVVSNLYVNIGISENTASAVVLSGNRTVTINTTQPHNLNPTNNVSIDTIDASISALISNDYYFLGTRTVITTPTPTSFEIIIGDSPTGSVTAPIMMTDNHQDFQYITVLTKSGLQPQIGDMLYSTPLIYRIIEAYMFDAIHFVVKVGNPVKALSDTLSYLYAAYTATLKFTPLTSGDLGTSKKWIEFQASFRNSDACSGCAIFFATDSINASPQINWTARVGTDAGTISFNKWGYSPWGNFAWSQGITTARQYGTAPCIHLRTYIPREACLGTYIQPTIQHNVAGEPFSLQSITVLTAKGSTSSTR